MFVRLTSDEPRTRPYQAGKTRQHPVTVQLIRPDELGPAEIATWHSMQGAIPPLADPFLSPEFARAVGRVQPDTHVAVLAERETITGFFPFERRQFGVGVPIGGWLSLSQGLIHAEGASWDARKLLSGCRLAAWEFDSLITDQQPFQPYHAGQVPVPTIDLSEGFGAYYANLQARSPRFCRELDRKIRKFGREVGETRIVPDSRDIDMLRMLMTWKSGQYRRTGHVDIFEPPWVVELLHDLLDTRSDHMTGMLSVLYAGDQPAAAQFGLRAGNIFHGWFTAYDPRFSSYSPGLILVKKMAEGFAAAGIDMIYMGRGSSSYKDAMKSRDVFVAEGVVTSRSVLGVAHRTRSSSTRWANVFVNAHPGLLKRARRIRRLVRPAYGRM
jgi:CelD/BcsL family acetyltransferase involved in cellulose biosynthesis